MKTSKLAMALVLILGLAILIGGCGGESATDKSTNGDQGSEEPAASEPAGALQAIKDKGVLVVGLDDSYPPMGYRDDKNQLIGFDIDMGEEIGKRIGVKVEWQPTDWDGVIASLQSKKFDIIISGMTVTPERQEAVNFTDAYVTAGVVMLVKEENNTLAKPEDLVGKAVGTQGGSSGEQVAKKIEGIKDLKLYKQFPEALADLEIGRTEAVIVDVTVAAHYLAQRPGVYKIACPVNEELFAIAVRKEDTDLLDELNRIIREMKSDGTMEEISMKWFGENVIAE